MPFKRYVEIGRVAMINYGPEYGKLVVISDVLDQSRALVDAPGRVRDVVNLRRLTLTDYKVDIPRLAPKKKVTEEFSKAGVEEKFKASSWGKKLTKQANAKSMTDFDRFKAMLAKTKKNRAVRTVLNKLQKTAPAKPTKAVAKSRK
uniref:Large ribosomal subunit protein eL14 domain-containing protein n=2 Tax=Eukaryota TaxID=2759 RepID=A0A7S3VM32_DUNTE|mmetsp:Transcript_14115/g.38166  ORF Transcript_14115/g.38166 Transcript_14115/m.38166 type:complete len:146 (-) Transcript_14115:271-708(-)